MDNQTPNSSKPSSSSDDTIGCLGIIGIIVIITIVGGIISMIQENWDSIIRVIGGGTVGIIATMIIGGCTSHNEKMQNTALGIYFLGVFFASVLSYIKYGLTSWIVLHGALSWIIILF